MRDITLFKKADLHCKFSTREYLYMLCVFRGTAPEIVSSQSLLIASNRCGVDECLVSVFVDGFYDV